MDFNLILKELDGAIQDSERAMDYASSAFNRLCDLRAEVEDQKNQVETEVEGD